MDNPVPLLSAKPSAGTGMIKLRCGTGSKIWITKKKVENSCHRKTFNISRTLVGNKIVDNSDVVGASPVGAAPTTSSFLT